MVYEVTGNCSYLQIVLSFQIVLQTMMEYPEIETCVEVSMIFSSFLLSSFQSMSSWESGGIASSSFQTYIIFSEGYPQYSLYLCSKCLHLILQLFFSLTVFSKDTQEHI